MIQKSAWGAGAALAITAAAGVSLLQNPSGAVAQQPQPGTTMQARCADAERQMHALFVQVKGLEGVLNRKQDDLNAAKGTDARLDAAVGMINELSDSRVKIREKEEAMRDLLIGHMVEHVTSKAPNRELELQSCPLFKDLHRSVDQQVQRGDDAQKRDQEKPKK